MRQPPVRVVRVATEVEVEVETVRIINPVQLLQDSNLSPQPLRLVVPSVRALPPHRVILRRFRHRILTVDRRF